MSGRGVLLILALLLLGASAIFFGRAWLLAQNQQPAPQPVVEAPKPVATMVMVAKADIPVGTFLREDLLGWQAWPNETLDPSYMVQGQNDPKTQQPYDTKSLVGTVARLPISAGQPMTNARIVRPGEQGFLAAALKPGMRAITVAVSETSGVAGLVFPGDRVDLLLTHEVKNAGGGETRHASETVLENIRILAIDQSLSHQTDQKNGAPQAVGRSATIEVTPKQAEMVAVAGTLGALSLSLRSLASINGGTTVTDIRDVPDPDRGTTFTMDTDVSRVLAIAPPRPPVVTRGNVQRSIEVIRGGKVEQSLVN
jgi:pilus assembly protein CpaB